MIDKQPVRGARGVYEALRAEIASGRLPPASALVETALAARFGVSRTPVREALRRLEQDRLVERGERGLRVREADPQEVLELYEARVLLESAVARAAAERRGAGDLALLEGLLDADLRDGVTDPVERARRNQTFHEALWRAAGNRVLVDLLQRLGLHLLRHPETTLSWPGRWEQSLDEHTVLVDAVRRRDPDAAAAAAVEHFEHARDVRLAAWRSAGHRDR
jgi:DNA-binding GntR family transcriptional regulator